MCQWNCEVCYGYVSATALLSFRTYLALLREQVRGFMPKIKYFQEKGGLGIKVDIEKKKRENQG